MIAHFTGKIYINFRSKKQQFSYMIYDFFIITKG